MIQPGARVEHPGWGTSVQDLGRQGTMRYGLTTGGAADAYALRWANRLLNNTPDTAALEILPGGFSVRLLANCQLAFTGADLQTTCDQKPIKPWSSGWFHAGSVLQWHTAKSGLRAYLAVSGGWQTPLCFGSRSTVLRESLGGIEGRSLICGDVLPMPAQRRQPNRVLEAKWQPNYELPLTLRYVTGYQFASFANAVLAQLHQTQYRISPQSNRMGIRLDGPALEQPKLLPRSEGIALGTIQITGAGQPIILMQERQTVGGYLKLGSVCWADCSLLAQRTSGNLVRFKPVPREKLQQERISWDEFFNSHAS